MLAVAGLALLVFVSPLARLLFWLHLPCAYAQFAAGDPVFFANFLLRCINKTA
jgi:hypothetical protein